MHDVTAFDTIISRLYRRGDGPLAIARALNLRPSDVIGRIRSLRLPPPAPTLAPAASAEDSLVGARARSAAARASGGVTALSPLTPDGSDRDCHRGGNAPSRTASSRHATTVTGLAKAVEERGDPAERVRGAGGDADGGGAGDLVTLPGRPRGWLVSEAQHARIFAAAPGGFEDVRLAPPAWSSSSPAPARHRRSAAARANVVGCDGTAR
jgi:hypothetical protein